MQLGTLSTSGRSQHPGVTVEDLRFRYRRRAPWALDGASFRTASNRVALLGPNGAGKTTLLHVLSLLLAPQEGRVQVGEYDFTLRPGTETFRRELGLVPQRLSTMHGLTCRQFLRYVCYLRRVPASIVPARILEAIESVDLVDSLDARVGTLSGGMKQRLALAQALVNRPRVLLLDEPTVSLDPAQRDHFLRMVGQIPEETTVVMTSHVSEDVAAFAHEVVVIDRGRTLAHGGLRDFCEIEDDRTPTGSDVKRAYIALLDVRAPA